MNGRIVDPLPLYLVLRPPSNYPWHPTWIAKTPLTSCLKPQYSQSRQRRSKDGAVDVESTVKSGEEQWSDVSLGVLK